MREPSLSVILITKNAARTLALCLEGAAPIASEIIILDSGSTDETLAIAKRFTDHVISTDWPGFGIQKQRALARAQGDWVLSLDADEVLTPAAQAEIAATIRHPAYTAYTILSVMVFADRRINHSGCTKPVLKLFKRGTADFDDKPVHEALVVTAPIGALRHPLLHYSYANLSDWIGKMNRYTDLECTRKRTRRYSVSYAVAAGLVAFIKMFVLKKGFLDGQLGLMASLNAGIASYYKYLKLTFHTDQSTNKTA